MAKRRTLRPKKTRSKIKSVKTGPKWTEVTLRLDTKRLGIQVGRARGKNK